MDDPSCVGLLQWALPRLGMRWAGFRKPRRQVCRRIQARVDALGLADVAAYRARLEADPDEWAVLDRLCFVTISRFYRDHSVWRALTDQVLPHFATLRAWSAGCASGEEPYTLVLAWALGLDRDLRDLYVVGTDTDEVVLERARRACYPAGALRGLPERWRELGFQTSGPEDDACCLRDRYKRVDLRRSDLRDGEVPDGGAFDLVLCRNLAFTYFDRAGQRDALEVLLGALRPGGALVTARRERPPAHPRLAPWVEGEGIWRRR